MNKNNFYPFFRPYNAPKAKGVYVSGPMTGVGDNNGPAFDQAAAELRRLGYAVCNPNETDSILGALDYETYLRFDTQRVLEADFLVALPLWERSRGATFEILTAIRIGTAVWGWENWKDYDKITEARVFAAIADLYSGRVETYSRQVRREAQALAEGRLGDNQPKPWEVRPNEEVREGSPAAPYSDSERWIDSVVREGLGHMEVVSQ